MCMPTAPLHLIKKVTKNRQTVNHIGSHQQQVNKTSKDKIIQI